MKLDKYFFLSIITSIFLIYSDKSTVVSEEISIIINADNGHKYFLTPIMSWESAVILAQKMGGNLVTINDKKENDWLVKNFIKPETNFFWIGINDVKNEGDFVWVNDEISHYHNWAKDEPNNNLKQGGEDFGVLNGYSNPFHRPVGTWSDAPTHAKLQGIVEIP